MANLWTAKKDLRRFLRQKLSTIPQHSIQSQSHETLLSLPEYRSATKLSIYLSMPKGEVSTRSIVTDALRQGKEVYVPYTSTVEEPVSGASSTIMDMVGLLSQEDFETLESDPWGIPTPSTSSIAGRKHCLGNCDTDEDSRGGDKGMQSLDIIIMPGMAFDRRFARLGHGKGYYDSFLARYQRSQTNSSSSESRMPFLVGLALTEQLLPEGQEVPVGPFDWSLNALIIGGDPVLRR
ncbi:MAG: hypothetical protein Q9216_002130 [Gyalolechia sp. 2 TL-2023]